VLEQTKDFDRRHGAKGQDVVAKEESALLGARNAFGHRSHGRGGLRGG
jgi:hypothetical protein